jgi:hypothetical protein
MKDTNLMKAARALAMVQLNCPKVYSLMVNTNKTFEERRSAAVEAAIEIDSIFGVQIRQAVEALLNTGCLNLGVYEDVIKTRIKEIEGHKWAVGQAMPGYYKTFKAAAERARKIYLGGYGVCSSVKHSVRGVRFGKEGKLFETKATCEKLHEYLRAKAGVKGIE